MLIFLHVPKTGGTTFLMSYLPAALRPNEFYVLTGATAAERERSGQALLTMSKDQIAKLKVVGGHEIEPFRSHLSGHFVSMVREPVDRCVSAYLHARFHYESPIATRLEREGIGLADFVAARAHLHNMQSRWLLGSSFDTIDWSSDDSILGAINERFSLIGLTEDFDAFIFHLHIMSNLPLALFNKRLVRQERARFQSTPSELDEVAKFNERDAILYRMLKQRWNAIVERSWAAGDRIRFERFAAALRVFRTSTRGDVDAMQAYGLSLHD